MKKIMSFIIAIVLVCGFLMTPGMQVYADSFQISGVPTSLKIDETFTLNITSPKGASAKIRVEYDANVLEFQSGKNASGGNGLVLITGGAWGEDKVTTDSVKFKAKGAGTSTIKVYTEDATDVEGNSIAIEAASASVTVKNEAETEKSNDAFLSSLKLSKGTLSPKFQYKKLNYTATVDYSVKSVSVSAKTSHAKATIDSVSGNKNLKVGKNTIKIVVKAENGTTKTYTVVVTRKEAPEESEGEPKPEEKPVEFDYSGQKLKLNTSIAKDSIPTGFEKEPMMVKGVETEILNFHNDALQLLSLSDDQNHKSLYVYNKMEQSVYPFIKLECNNNYIIVLTPTSAVEIPKDYQLNTLSIEGKGVVTAYQRKEQASDFYLLYTMNQNGDFGWYQYDVLEATFQRFMDQRTEEETPPTNPMVPDTEESMTPPEDGNTSDELKELQSKYQFLISAIIFVLAATILIAINLLLLRYKKKHGNDENADDEENMEEDDAIEVEKVFVEKKPNESKDHPKEKTQETSDEEIEVELSEMTAKLSADLASYEGIKEKKKEDTNEDWTNVDAEEDDDFKFIDL